MNYQYEVICANGVSPANGIEPAFLNPVCPNGGLFPGCANLVSCAPAPPPVTNVNCPCPNNGCPEPPPVHRCFLV